MLLFLSNKHAVEFILITTIQEVYFEQGDKTLTWKRPAFVEKRFDVPDSDSMSSPDSKLR